VTWSLGWDNRGGLRTKWLARLLASIFTIILERLDLLISGWILIFFSFTSREQGECWVDGIGQRTASMTSGPSGTRPCIFLLTINVKLELWEQQAEKGEQPRVIPIQQRPKCSPSTACEILDALTG
jgi:hypothetical protein